MKLRIAVVAVAMVLLTSCSSLPANTIELLAAPKLNQRQAEVYAALEQTISTRDIVFEYPQTGQYRSSFVFFDVDGDGEQEAIVFYSYAKEPSAVRVKVLKKGADGWGSVHDFSGGGSQVDFLEFAHISSTESMHMLVGWKDTQSDQATLAVYSLAQDMKEETSQPYLHYLRRDFDGDGLEEVALVARGTGADPYQLVLIRAMQGFVGRGGSVKLSREAVDILQLACGKLYDGRMALFIDESFSGSVVGTEIVAVTPQGLESIAGDGEAQWELFSQTFRDMELLSADVDNNGSVEIPRPLDLPYPMGTEEESELYFTQYFQLTEEGLLPQYTMAINQEGGYGLFLPERWQGRVTMMRQAENNEWRFYKLDADSGEPKTELLRIRIYATRDVQDKFTQDYLLLETRGAYRYYAYLPPLAEEPLALTPAQLKSLFRLL